jgi:hypothetical protein
MNKTGLILNSALVMMLSLSTALAQTSSSGEGSDGWSFAFAPYIWISGLKGDVATLPPAPPAQVDADFGDIVENLDIAFMGIGEARKGRLGLLADIVYLKISADAETPGPFFSGANLEAKSFIGTFEASYRIVDENKGSVDLLAGARIWSVTTELALGAGILAAQRRQNSETWIDPVIGIKGRLILDPEFYLTAMANLGGFGVGSDTTWDVFGGLGYQVNNWFSAVIGYRHLAVDYKEGNFIFDVEMSGPVIGGVFRF